MRKAIFKILVVAAFIVALAFNVSLNKDESSSDLRLLDISLSTDTNAECIPASTAFTIGNCSASGNYCFVNAEIQMCNP